MGKTTPVLTSHIRQDVAHVAPEGTCILSADRETAQGRGVERESGSGAGEDTRFHKEEDAHARRNSPGE
jgi:hypothetical protein